MTAHMVGRQRPASSTVAGLLRLVRYSSAVTSWCFTTPGTNDADDAAGTPCVVKRSKYGGLGLFAARNIRAGERILVEAPLATWCVPADASSSDKTRSFELMVSKLSNQSKEALRQLSQSHLYGDTQSLLGIWQTNALPINTESETRPGTTTRELLSKREAAVFATISRANHSCKPNSHHSWNSRLGQETIHAIVDILQGEEVTICYLSPRGMERQRRRTLLQAEHGFVCRCELCELTGEEFEASEARQRALGELLRPDDSKLELAQLVQRADVRLKLMALEALPEIWVWKPLLYYLATASMAEVNRMTSTAEAVQRRVAAWAERAHAVVHTALGADHATTDFMASFLQRALL